MVTVQSKCIASHVKIFLWRLRIVWFARYLYLYGQQNGALENSVQNYQQADYVLFSCYSLQQLLLQGHILCLRRQYSLLASFDQVPLLDNTVCTVEAKNIIRLLKINNQCNHF